MEDYQAGNGWLSLCMKNLTWLTYLLQAHSKRRNLHSGTWNCSFLVSPQL